MDSSSRSSRSCRWNLRSRSIGLSTCRWKVPSADAIRSGQFLDRTPMTTGFSQQTLEAVASGEPGWLTSQRRTAWQTFEKLPLPTKRDLQWQRFDIRTLKLDKVAISVDKPAIVERLTPLPPELSKQGVIFCDMATAL